MGNSEVFRAPMHRLINNKHKPNETMKSAISAYTSQI